MKEFHAKLNPDKEHVKMIREGLKAKDGYCPCKIPKLPEFKCPCVEFCETGHCCCGLYVLEENTSE